MIKNSSSDVEYKERPNIFIPTVHSLPTKLEREKLLSNNGSDNNVLYQIYKYILSDNWGK